MGEQVVAVLRAVRFLDLLQLAHEPPDGQVVVEHLEVVVLFHRLRQLRLMTTTSESQSRSYSEARLHAGQRHYPAYPHATLAPRAHL